MKNIVNIDVKTFYGIRSQFNLDISIEEPISNLINFLCEFEKGLCEIENKNLKDEAYEKYFESSKNERIKKFSVFLY